MLLGKEFKFKIALSKKCALQIVTIQDDPSARQLNFVVFDLFHMSLAEHQSLDMQLINCEKLIEIAWQLDSALE